MHAIANVSHTMVSDISFMIGIRHYFEQDT